MVDAHPLHRIALAIVQWFPLAFTQPLAGLHSIEFFLGSS